MVMGRRAASVGYDKGQQYHETGNCDHDAGNDQTCSWRQCARFGVSKTIETKQARCSKKFQSSRPQGTNADWCGLAMRLREHKKTEKWQAD